MESKELPEGELPVQLLESIANEAKEVAKDKCSNRTYSYTLGYEDGYFIGATSYVEWKVKYDELKAENEQLRRWKAEALMLLSLVDAYADKHPEIKLGQGKVEFTIARAKERDTLKERCEKMEAALKWALYHAKECQKNHGIEAGNLIDAIAEALKEGESNTPAPGEGEIAVYKQVGSKTNNNPH